MLKNCIIAVLLMTGIVFAQSSKPPTGGEPPAHQIEQKTTPNLRGTDQSPFVIKILQPENAKKKADNDERERKEKVLVDRKLGFETQRIADYTWWLAGFTLAVAFGTILLGYATLKAAKAADRTVTITENTQRAYISALNPQWKFVSGKSGSPNDLKVSITWKNTGITPAIDVVNLIGVTFVPKGQTFVFGSPGENQERRPLALGPGSEIQTGSLRISGHHVAAAASEQGTQYFWGKVEYRDIFAGTRTHIVEFCFQLQFPSQTSVAFAPAETNNRYYDA